MKCPIETGENSALLAYSRERLDAPQAEALERHLRGCRACRQFVEEQRTVWRALDAWEPPTVSADFDRRLYRLLETQEKSGWWERWLRPVLTHRALPLGAAACLVVAVGLMVRPGMRPAPQPVPGQAQAQQAEQIKHALDDLELLSDFTRPPRSDAGEL